MANSLMTEVHLLHVPLESDYKHTLYFAGKSNQESYFKGKILKSYTKLSYQRKDNAIYVPSKYDDIYSANYVMYKNEGDSTKWYYAFVKELEYENDGCTRVVIETDVMQTWLNEYNVKPSFVEREHVKDDTIGKHTIPEGLELGDYITTSIKLDDQTNGESDTYGIGVAFSDYNDDSVDVVGKNIGGVYSGVQYDAYLNNKTGINYLNAFINSYDKEGKADAIVSIFMVPGWLITEPDAAGRVSPHDGDTPVEKDITISKLRSLNGHTPKNKKLLTYPYYYLNVYNGAGSNAIYKPEMFSDDVSFTFTKYGVFTPGCSITLVPTGYDNVEKNYQSALSGAKYPICCWNSDTYTNWQTQNAVNNAFSNIGAAASFIGGAALLGTGAGAMVGLGMMAGGVGTIAKLMGQSHQAKLTPDEAKGNTNCGDVFAGLKANTYQFHTMTIKKEYARTIDKFFSMFGYQVNDVKVPNKNHRSKYWYTKTVDVNIDGNIPQSDLQKIKDCYNAGITFWRNASEIQVYTDSNDDLIDNDIV